MISLTIRTKCHASRETLVSNRATAPKKPPPHGQGHLAIVGGGASIHSHVDELRTWEGDIWAINGTYHWLKERQIDSAFCTVDPHPILAEMCQGSTKAVIADHSDPALFAALEGADVYVATGEHSGPTSVVTASVWAISSGYDTVTLFGCEASYGDTTHAYNTPERRLDLARVECGGESFLTKLELIAQTEQLSKIIEAFPEIFAERCGGFLRALVKHGEYDVTHLARHVFENLTMEAA